MPKKQTDGRVRAMFVSFGQTYDPQDDTSTGGGDNDGYRLHVRSWVVTCEEDGSDIRGESYGSGFEHRIRAEHLTDFWVRCDARRKDEGRVAHIDAEYHDVLTVGRRRAELMAYTFAYLDRGRERLANQHGWEEDAGQYITRVGIILGATRVIIAPRDGQSGGYDRNAARYAHLSLGQGVEAINSRARAWANGAQEDSAPAWR